MCILDIIIPTYNNVEGLDKTLSSIDTSLLNEGITITVVNDCSKIDYSEIEKKYNYVNFLKLGYNSGPGIARQFGVQNTKNPYILFIDSGDYINSKFGILEALDAIKSKPEIVLFSWPWLCVGKDITSLRKPSNALLHGKVIKREFLDKYTITFSTNEPYANEDIAYIRQINLFIESVEDLEKHKLREDYQLPFYMYIIDDNSIVHANNGAFSYLKQVRGLVMNEVYSIDNYRKYFGDDKSVKQECAFILSRVYYDFIDILIHHPEYAQDNWDYIRYFFLYAENMFHETILDAISDGFSLWTKFFKKLKDFPPNYRMNPRVFYNDVFNNVLIPERYFNI